MANSTNADPRRMYSWWWNSHISPKNSKWLQENLTDMDVKVKAMIKLIEEDADSFARRAEMYYKKRPELMKLVEEFYRAYRALAERYDHATGALRQAHKTMAEAFPNHPMLSDDSPANSAYDADPQTPEMKTPSRALFDLDDFQKDSLEFSSSRFPGGKKNGSLNDDLFGPRAKFSEGMVRKGLNFVESDDRFQAQAVSESEETNKEILVLKEALAKLEDEREAGLKQYRESLERLSKLESEVIRAQEDSRELTERATIAEAEAQTLKESLARLDAEKEESLVRYQECLDRISNLENVLSHSQEYIAELNEKSRKGESEAHNLKQDIAKLEAEKDAALAQYTQSSETILDLEKKLLHAEEEGRRFRDRAEKAESEVETLQKAIAKFTEEKEAEALLYQQCLETISSLEYRLACAEKEAERLNGEINNGVAKLKGAEEQCLMLERSNQSLHSELESMVMKMGTQTQELTEKQKELGRLWACVQEERLRFVEAETAFQTLQHLHSQAQEELRSVAAELQNRAQILRDMEIHKQDLQEEILKHKEENKNLNDLNSSSAVSMKEMQDEIFSLKESKGKLEEEVELRVDQRNALQQEIYCLKEELNELNKNHVSILEQVASVGLKPENVESSVKELQNENLSLKEDCEKERSEKLALLKKLEIMEQLLEKNAVLENSLSDLGAELDSVRGKMKALEESCQSLIEEKSALTDEKTNLLDQLKATTESLGKVSEKNTILETSLLDAHVELEVLKAKSRSLEDSRASLENEKSVLIGEKGTLISQVEISLNSLKDLEVRYAGLDKKYASLEKERESTLHKLEELQVSLALQNQEHVSFTQMNEVKLASMESQIQLLHAENRQRRKEFEEELDKALDSQIELFILLRCVQNLEESNSTLFNDYKKLLESSRLSEKQIHKLKQENFESQVEIKFLSDHVNTLRIGMHQLLKVADVVADHVCEDKRAYDKVCLNRILGKAEHTKNALVETEDENRQLVVEMCILVTLLRQLKTELANIEMERNAIGQELSMRTEKFLELQCETHKLLETNEELRLKVSEGDRKEKVLLAQIENLYGELESAQGAYRNLQMEMSEAIGENISLMDKLLRAEERNRTLEEENIIILDEVLSQRTLALIFKSSLDEKSVEGYGLSENLQKINGVNSALEEKLSRMEKNMDEVQSENMHLKETLKKAEHDLETVILVRGQLGSEIVNVKNLKHQKEMELMEAERKLGISENDKVELNKVVADLERAYNEVKMTKEEQGKRILDLSEDNVRLSNEIVFLQEASQTAELEMYQLREEHEKTKNKEKSLHSELKQERDEAELLVIQAAAMYEELQASTICRALFEGKVHELTEVLDNLQEENNSKDMCIKLLNEQARILEAESGGLKAQLEKYGPALLSLRECISSLETRSCIQTHLQKSNNEEIKVTELVNDQDPKSCLNGDKKTVVPDAFEDIQDLKSRVKAIDNAMFEMDRLTMQELRFRRSSHRENPKRTSEISEADAGLLTKDIVLDQASECSSYGRSRRELVGSGGHMLELWETADQEGIIDMNVSKTKKTDKYNTSDHHMLAEKELEVDKLEVSKRFKKHGEEGTKRKVLERLNSDVQKLTNLHITVQDLKRKVEFTEKRKKGKAMLEIDTLKGQLEEAEEEILKLFDLNGKLMKNIDDRPFTPDKKSTMEMEENAGVKKKRSSEQARRISERIGRLQLEVQKIQFVLLKLDDEKEDKVRSRILDARRRVLLKDYLYGGGGKTQQKRKKAPFCACIRPPTRGDLSN